jgi:hypothetical protein
MPEKNDLIFAGDIADSSDLATDADLKRQRRRLLWKLDSR